MMFVVISYDYAMLCAAMKLYALVLVAMLVVSATYIGSADAVTGGGSCCKLHTFFITSIRIGTVNVIYANTPFSSRH